MISEIADVIYKCSAYYDAESEGGIAFDDPDVGIAWPADVDLQPSERDSTAPGLHEIADLLPFSYSGEDPFRTDFAVLYMTA